MTVNQHTMREEEEGSEKGAQNPLQRDGRTLFRATTARVDQEDMERTREVANKRRNAKEAKQVGSKAMSFKMKFQKQTAHLHEADELIYSLTAMREMIPCRDSLKQDPSVRSMLDMASPPAGSVQQGGQPRKKLARPITTIQVDKMVVRTLGARDACHEFVVEFSKKFHETFLEVEVSSLKNVYEALDFYVRKGEAASPTMFDIGSAKKNCIHIRPGRSKFGYGRYYIAVASNGQTTRYSITCRQLYFRPDLLTPHEKAARTMINAELKSRIHQAGRRRADSRNGYTEALERRKYLQETFSGGKETPR